MLIVALVLAVIGLAALVTAVVTSNEMIAWVCIGASGLGVLLLVFDAIRDRTRRRPALAAETPAETTAVIPPVRPEPAYVDDDAIYADYEDEIDSSAEEYDEIAEDHPDEIAEDHPDEIAEDHPDEIAEDHPDEIVHDEPEYDTFSDDEPELPEPAEEAAVHTVSEEYLAAELDEDIADEPVVVEEALVVEERVVEEPVEEPVVVPEAVEAAPAVEVLSAEAFVTEIRYSGEPVAEPAPEPAPEPATYTHVEAEETPSYTYVEADEVRSYTYVEADESDEDKK